MKPTLDIRRKLAALVLLVVATLVAALTAFSTSAELSSRRAGMGRKADLYARFAAHQLEPAVAFDDRETTREVFASLALDPEIQALALIGGKGETIGGYGELARERGAEVVSAQAASVSREGPRGMVIVQLSTSGLVAAQRRTIATHLAAGLLAIMLGMAASWAIGGSFARRLRTIGRATQRVAAGDLDVPPVIDASKDEIGCLAADFNVMSLAIRTHVASIAEAAAEEQTRELSLRNEAMRRVLDNVDQGFLTVAADGRMSSERSAILDTWFGESNADETLCDYIARVDAHCADWLRVGWSAAFDDFLPLELALEQLPKRIRTIDGDLQVDYKPIFFGEGRVEAVLVVISDVSLEVARARAESREREVATLCRHVLEDRPAVEELMREGAQLVRALSEPDATITDVRRHIHTLKGNASLFGLDRMVHLCHEAESAISASEDDSTAARLPIRAAWFELSEALAFLVGPSRANRVELDVEEVDAVARLVDDGAPRSTIVDRISALRLEPAERRLQRVAGQVRATAARLGKHDVTVHIDGGGVRLNAERWAPFWTSLVHVVRNAVDHGLEDRAERARLGKPGDGEITLRCFESPSGSEIVVEVGDDGCGIDWDALRKEGRAGSDLVEKLFTDGVSTKSTVTELSGRGVGLGAVRRACEALGGRVDVTSERGRGTRFSFRVPRLPNIEKRQSMMIPRGA